MLGLLDYLFLSTLTAQVRTRPKYMVKKVFFMEN